MKTSDEHTQRIASELKEAGASSYGASKFASRYLPTVIHPDEHVKAAVYGRYEEGGGLLSLSAGMLVATESRIIFLDHKPGFTSMDEITYEVVSGVKKVTSALASTLTLHTRVGDYVIRFANESGAEKFMHYIEKRRLEVISNVSQNNTLPAATASPVSAIDKAALEFLRKHEIAVLSTINRTGNLHGATIYYYIDNGNRICLATKTSTQKARDIFANQQVALTAYDADTIETVQMQGFAQVVTDPAEQQEIFEQIIKPRDYQGEMRLPPVTTLHDESYVALRIIPTTARYTDYKKRLEE
jgi:general stress protein 26